MLGQREAAQRGGQGSRAGQRRCQAMQQALSCRGVVQTGGPASGAAQRIPPHLTPAAVGQQVDRRSGMRGGGWQPAVLSPSCTSFQSAFRMRAARLFATHCQPLASTPPRLCALPAAAAAGGGAAPAARLLRGCGAGGGRREGGVVGRDHGLATRQKWHSQRWRCAHVRALAVVVPPLLDTPRRFVRADGLCNQAAKPRRQTRANWLGRHAAAHLMCI